MIFQQVQGEKKVKKNNFDVSHCTIILYHNAQPQTFQEIMRTIFVFWMTNTGQLNSSFKYFNNIKVGETLPHSWALCMKQTCNTSDIIGNTTKYCMAMTDSRATSSLMLLHCIPSLHLHILISTMHALTYLQSTLNTIWCRIQGDDRLLSDPSQSSTHRMTNPPPTLPCFFLPLR